MVPVTTSSSVTWKFVRIEECGDFPSLTYSIRSSRGGDPVVCGLTSHAGDSDAANFENHGYRPSSRLFSLWNLFHSSRPVLSRLQGACKSLDLVKTADSDSAGLRAAWESVFLASSRWGSQIVFSSNENLCFYLVKNKSILFLPGQSQRAVS